MKPGIEVTHEWSDVDVVHLRIAACNGDFGAATLTYIPVREHVAVADMLDGFPMNPTDEREVSFGDVDGNGAFGGVRLRFYCLGGFAHAYVDITIGGDYFGGRFKQRADFALAIEAAAVDRFVGQLRALGEQGEKALLSGADPARRYLTW